MQVEQGLENGETAAAGSFTPLKAPPRAVATPLEKAMGGGTEEEKAEQAELERLAGTTNVVVFLMNRLMIFHIFEKL